MAFPYMKAFLSLLYVMPFSLSPSLSLARSLSIAHLLNSPSQLLSLLSSGRKLTLLLDLQANPPARLPLLDLPRCHRHHSLSAGPRRRIARDHALHPRQSPRRTADRHNPAQSPQGREDAALHARRPVTHPSFHRHPPKQAPSDGQGHSSRTLPHHYLLRRRCELAPNRLALDPGSL